jgi:predicted XRE-type DNA-binding protein
MPSGPANTRRTKRTPDVSPARVGPSTGNVFEDLALPRPDLALAKAEIVLRIRRLIEAGGMTQAQAGGLLGLDQSKVSNLMRGRVEGFSLDRLFRLLNALGQRVEIHIRPNGGGAGSAGRGILVRK